RCTSVCPANAAGKSLSPRDIILDLRNFARGAGDSAFAAPIVNTVPAASAERLWQCTTCGACMEECPAFIEQMPNIRDLRRYLVMEESDCPDTMREAITSLEWRGYPFRGTQSSRVDWADGLNVKTIGEARDAEVLLWVGCGGALIERNQKVVRATAQL